MPNFGIDKVYMKYFVQILHICASSLWFLEVFCWFFSKCPAASSPRSCRILWENASKTLQKWKWWRAHMQYLNKIFYVYLINPKVWYCLYILSKVWQNYNWVKILIIQLSPASGNVFEYFYREIKCKRNQFYFFRWIGQMIMKFFPSLIFSIFEKIHKQCRTLALIIYT